LTNHLAATLKVVKKVKVVISQLAGGGG
jgi:hypothetical protein